MNFLFRLVHRMIVVDMECGRFVCTGGSKCYQVYIERMGEQIISCCSDAIWMHYLYKDY